MIILFSGSHGTGKSTIIDEFRYTKYAKDFIIGDSISERFFKREDFKNPDRMVNLQRKFTEYQLEVFSTPNTISSRGYADIHSYTRYLFMNNPDPDYLKQLDMIEFAALDSQANSVYFPITFDLVGKELRSTNKEFQKEIDDYIQQFFKSLHLDHKTMISGDPKTRLDWLIETFF